MDCFPLSTLILVADFLPFHYPAAVLVLSPHTKRFSSPRPERCRIYSVFGESTRKRCVTTEVGKTSWMNAQVTQLFRSWNTQLPLQAWDGDSLHLVYCKTTGAL